MEYLKYPPQNLNSIDEAGVTVYFLPKEIERNVENYIPKNLILRKVRSIFLTAVIVRGIHVSSNPEEVVGLPRMYFTCVQSRSVLNLVLHYRVKIPPIVRSPWVIFSIEDPRVKENKNRVIIVVMKSYDLMNRIFLHDGISLIIKQLSHLFDSWYFVRFRKFKDIIKVLELPKSVLFIEELSNSSFHKLLYMDILNEKYLSQLLSEMGPRVYFIKQIYFMIMSILLMVFSFKHLKILLKLIQVKILLKLIQEYWRLLKLFFVDNIQHLIYYF